MFTSFLFKPSFGVVSEDRKIVRALGNWENKVTVTMPENIGAVAAEIVLGALNVQGVIYTAGETASYGRLAGMPEKVWERNLEREFWSVEMLKGELAKDPGNGLKEYRVVFAEAEGRSLERRRDFQ